MIIKGGLQGQPGNPNDPNDEGVFISKVNPLSVADRTADLKVGQRIIEVNGQSLLGATHQEAVTALRAAGDSIHLLLCDGFDDPDAPAPAQIEAANPPAKSSSSSSSSPSSSSETRSPSSVVVLEKQETETVKESYPAEEIEERPNSVQEKVGSL